MKSIRYGDLLRHTRPTARRVNFSALTRLQRVRHRRRLGGGVTLTQLRRLLVPYIGGLGWDQVRAVGPLVVYLILFQLAVLHTALDGPAGIALGLGAVVIGLMMFMEGLRTGLMPFGESIGHHLPQRLPLPAVLAVAFVLGIGVTFAEPAIGALQAAGALVDPATAPYLAALLGPWSGGLVACVALGVGAAALLGTLRFLRGWSLKPMIFASLGLTLGLTSVAALVPGLDPVIALAWDCGAVTTGPVTVPLVLALGIGVAGAAGDDDSALSGFGIVTLASLFPVAAVLMLGLGLALFADPASLATQAAATVSTSSWLDTLPWAEMIGGLRAIVPLVLFLALVNHYLARAKVEERSLTLFGIGLAVVGMIVFNLGLTTGLSALGAQAGSLAPATFVGLDTVSGSPLYPWAAGVCVALGFAAMLGFGATLAEPALNALGTTVETLTNGAFTRRTLILAVSVGVAAGLAMGLAKMIFGIPILWLVLPGYGLAAALTLISDETFVNVAWDSAGVTTGPVTVPLVLAMGLGFGQAVGAGDGFGILAMASIGPIVAVLGVGLAVRLRQRQAQQVVPSLSSIAVTESPS